MKRYWYAAYQNNPRGHTNVDEFLGVGKITFFSFPGEDGEKAGKAFLTRMEDLDLQA